MDMLIYRASYTAMNGSLKKNFAYLPLHIILSKSVPATSYNV